MAVGHSDKTFNPPNSFINAPTPPLSPNLPALKIPPAPSLMSAAEPAGHSALPPSVVFYLVGPPAAVRPRLPAAALTLEQLSLAETIALTP